MDPRIPSNHSLRIRAGVNTTTYRPTTLSGKRLFTRIAAQVKAASASRGEGGGENDSHDSGRSTADDFGPILRIDVAKFPMAVGGNLAGHVWSYGFRNPWRFSFDRVAGDMYIGMSAKRSAPASKE